MFTPQRAEPWSSWTNDHQYLYSLLWSSFLDLDAYSASRFRRRFFPYSTEFVVRELLWDVAPEVRALEIGRTERSRIADGTAPRLSDRFRELALWTVVPRLFGQLTFEGPLRSCRPRYDADDLARVAEPLKSIVADQLRLNLDVEVAAFRFDAETRPLLPPGLGLGIEDAQLTVVAGRRRASARLSAAVQVQYDGDAPVARVVDPSTWGIFEYWAPPSEAATGANSGTVATKLLLPGGNSASETKWRALQMEYVKTMTPFEARVDFDCRELGPAAKLSRLDEVFEVDRAIEVTDSKVPGEDRRYIESYSPAAPHIERLRGYLRLEKIAGRPGWSRFEAEREARFDSPNHDRFRVETLMFWLTCDLLSFAETYASPKDDPA